MFRLTSANITPTQGYRPFRCRGRRATVSAITVGAMAITLLAPAHIFAQAPENSSRMEREQYACTIVMGLHPPGDRDLYEICIRSLNETLSELDRARVASTAGIACVRQGLRPGTAAFDTCVVNAEQSAADSGHSATIAPPR